MMLYHDSTTTGLDFDDAVFSTACAYALFFRDVLPSCLTNPKTVELAYVTKVSICLSRDKP
eukprot:2476803-Amphidinium_carterae.1